MRGRFSLVILSAVLVLLGAGQVQAAEHGDDGGFFGKAIDLAVWTVVVFLVLVFVRDALRLEADP